MAKIWMHKSGEAQRGERADDRPLNFCIDELQLRQDDWIAPLDKKDPLIIGEKEDPTRTPFRGLRFVVVEINNDDLSCKSPDWRTGYYLLKSLDATQASKILQQNTRDPSLKEPIQNEFTSVDDIQKRIAELEREIASTKDGSRRHQIASELQALILRLDELKRKLRR